MESIFSFLLVANKDVPGPMPLVGFTGMELRQYPSVMNRRKFTIQIQKHEHLS